MPILIVVGVIVIVILAGVAYKLKNSSSSSSKPTGTPPGRLAKDLYKAWQDGNQTAAAKSATPAAVTQLFAIKTSEGTTLTYGGCSKTSAAPLPKLCVWSRPGGELEMTVVKQANGKKVVSSVTLGSAATTPPSS